MELYFVLRSRALSGVTVSAFPGGALISQGSLLVAAVGERLLQRAEWLSGLPEYINWDGGVSVVLAPGKVLDQRFTLPAQSLAFTGAGNTHGVYETYVWTGARFKLGAPPPDARRLKLGAPEAELAARAFADGSLVVARQSSRGVVLHRFGPGSAAAQTNELAWRDTDGLPPQLVGKSASDLYFCVSDRIAHFDGSSWSDVPLPAAAQRWDTAVMANGTLFAIFGVGADARLLRRVPGEDWQRVRLPNDCQPELLAAEGERLWVRASSSESGSALLSNVRVEQPLDVGEDQLPENANDPEGMGITGLDVESVDVPSVSASPAGPGTAACSSLVVYLGAGESEISRAKSALLELGTEQAAQAVLTLGAEPGHVVLESQRYRVGSEWLTRSAARVVASKKTRRALALVPKSYAEGKALLAALKPRLPDQRVRLLCAVPRAMGPDRASR
jgi:hypothetical protein